MYITRWSTPKSDWLYSLEPKMEKLYLFSSLAYHNLPLLHVIFSKNQFPRLSFIFSFNSAPLACGNSRQKTDSLMQTLFYSVFWEHLTLLMGFPGHASGKEPASQCRRHKWYRFNPWVPPGKIPLEKGMTAHSSILAWTIPWTEEPGGLRLCW